MDDDPTDSLARRPAGVDDATVDAVGVLGEAIEALERARGRLYDFHQMMGHTDLCLGEAAERLREAGHEELAVRLEREVIGRNVIPGRWTFQVVEEFDAGYYALAKEVEAAVRERLVDGRPHVREAEMKERRRTGGRAGHEAGPGPGR